MAFLPHGKSATYGQRLVHAIWTRYFMSCYNKLAHRDSITALQHAVSLSKRHPNKTFSIYVCEFCTCLHVGRGNHMLAEDADV